MCTFMPIAAAARVKPATTTTTTASHHPTKGDATEVSGGRPRSRNPPFLTDVSAACNVSGNVGGGHLGSPASRKVYWVVNAVARNGSSSWLWRRRLCAGGTLGALKMACINTSSMDINAPPLLCDVTTLSRRKQTAFTHTLLFWEIVKQALCLPSHCGYNYGKFHTKIRASLL